MIALLMSTSFGQTFVPVEVCVLLDTNFSEVSPFWDWYTDASILRYMRGVRVGAVTTNHDTHAYAVVHGSDRGCATLSLIAEEKYELIAFSELEIDGRSVVARHGPSSNPWAVGLGSYTPTSAASIDRYLAWRPYWGALQIAGWMLHRSSWDIPASTDLQMRFDNGPYVQGGTVFLENAQSARVISHEIGHWINWAADGKKSPDQDYSADDTDCNTFDPYIVGGDDFEGARPLSREHDSGAFVEGWGNFVTAWSFNSRVQKDCSFVEDREADYDLDGVEDNYRYAIPQSPFRPRIPTPYSGSYSCAGHPNDFNSDGLLQSPSNVALFEQPTGGSWLSERDWLEDMQANPDPTVCTQPIEGFSTSLDYTRFLWDVTSTEDVHPVYLSRILDSANPHNWNAIASPVSGQNESNDVIRRLEQAFTSEGFPGAFFAQRNNGQDHY